MRRGPDFRPPPSLYDRVMAHVVLIVNPFASRVTERRLREVESSLARAGKVETLVTERRGHATELAASPADAVVVFGGDGVVNEALNGIAEGVLFGAVPGGGTSVFARALGLPRDPVAAAAQVAEAIVAGRTRRIGLGRVEGRRFGFAAGLGFDAATVRRVDALGRSREGKRPGDLAFAYQLARLLGASRFRLEPALEVHGLGRAAAAFVANCDPYTYAGRVALHVAPAARFELGLDLVAPVRIAPRNLPRLTRYVLSGRGQDSAPDVLYEHDVDRIEITCDRPLPLQADGEDLGDVEQVVFEAEREALTILV
jgi:diacylglycerol kinase family enzyme